jgi:predicted nucleic acid-binding protein
MKIVDTNVVAYMLIKGTFTEQAQTLLRKDPDWRAPQLWKSEFQNVLATYIRNKHINLAQALFLMEKAELILRDGEYRVQSRDVLELSEQSGCSACDCEYIALARDLACPLITTDKKLLKAFPKLTKHLADQ